MSKIYNLPVPFFSQRECKYVWYQLNNDGTRTKDQQNKDKPGVSLAWGSRNIVSLCMILHYYGITTDSPDEMMRKFFDARDGKKCA